MTEKIEQELLEIEEIDQLESTSRLGFSTINVQLKDQIVDVDPVWARVRDQVNDVVPQLPDSADTPNFDQTEIQANALIVGLTWELDTPPNYAILRRWSEELQDRLRSLLGTKQVELYGTPTEEIAVTVSPQRLNAFDSLDRFEAELSQGVDLQIIFNQSIYVEAQLSLVINNLIMAGFLVVVVTFFMMGWKSSLIVGLALPLATFTVFGCMQVLQIPLHNTSITGVIIALGLLIDNAIIKDQKLFVNKR